MKTKSFSVSIKDCIVETFRCGGAGGQNVNKRETGVRVRHEPSGAVGEGREHREQHRNKVSAFIKMANSDKFQKWVKVEASRRAGKPTPEEIVEKMMDSKNIRIQYKVDGKWVTVE
jgi:protein subunit release factor B